MRKLSVIILLLLSLTSVSISASIYDPPMFVGPETAESPLTPFERTAKFIVNGEGSFIIEENVSEPKEDIPHVDVIDEVPVEDELDPIVDFEVDPVQPETEDEEPIIEEPGDTPIEVKPLYCPKGQKAKITSNPIVNLSNVISDTIEVTFDLCYGVFEGFSGHLGVLTNEHYYLDNDVYHIKVDLIRDFFEKNPNWVQVLLSYVLYYAHEPNEYEVGIHGDSVIGYIVIRR